MAPIGIRRRVLAAILAAGALLPIGARADTTVDRVVLRVNGRIATLFDYEDRKSDRLAALSRADLDPDRRQQLVSEAGETTMRDMFDELLLLSRADQLDLTASSTQVDDAVERARQSFGIKNDEQFKEALAQSGLTEAEFREQIHRNLLIQEVIGREVRSRIKIEDEALRRYYQAHLEEFAVPERMHLQEVVVLDSSGLDQQEMQQVAEEIRSDLAAGKALKDAVAEDAEKGTTSQEVDLGWVEGADLAPELAAAVSGLEPGQASQPVAGRGGLHILQLVDRQAAGTRSFEEVEPELRSREENRRFNDELAKYLRELAAKSYVRSEPPPDAAGFRPETTRPSEEDLQGFKAPVGSPPGKEPATESEPEPASPTAGAPPAASPAPAAKGSPEEPLPPDDVPPPPPAG